MAWDHQLDSRPLIIADVQTREDALRFNVTNETLNKVLDIGRNKYGVEIHLSLERLTEQEILMLVFFV